MDSIITYLKPVSVLKMLFGIVVILFAFFVFFFGSILFSFFMLAFAVYLISTEGSQVNLNTKMYRTIWSIFAIHFGKWQEIPDFEYISVFKGRQKQRVNSLAATTTFTDEVFLINLFYDRNKHITFYRTMSKEEAFKIAEHFKLALNLDILDATGRDQKWVD